MYVNTLISLQENIPTYGVEGKTVTGHVTISTPGIIKCYVQDLKRTRNRVFELYVLSSKKNTGVKIGELSEDKETKWRVDERNVMGGDIALQDIDGVAIIVKEDEFRGVDAILIGFKEERFTILPILESIVPKPKNTSKESVVDKSKPEANVPSEVEINTSLKKSEINTSPKPETNVSSEVEINTSLKAEANGAPEVETNTSLRPEANMSLEVETDTLSRPETNVSSEIENNVALGPSVHILMESEFQLPPESNIPPRPSIPSRPRHNVPREVGINVPQELGPTINLQATIPGGPGPVINPETTIAGGPGPVINPETTIAGGPGPVINPKTTIPGGPGPVINPQTTVPGGPGPVIKPETTIAGGPGPVINPETTIPEEPGPIIIPESSVPQCPVHKMYSNSVKTLDENDPDSQVDENDELEGGDSPVIVQEEDTERIVEEVKLQLEKLTESYDDSKKDSLDDAITRSNAAIKQITEKLKQSKNMIKKLNEVDRAQSVGEAEEREKLETIERIKRIDKVGQMIKVEKAVRLARKEEIAEDDRIPEEVWDLTGGQYETEKEPEIELELEGKDMIDAKETPEEIDYLEEIEKKLQDIQGRLKNVPRQVEIEDNQEEDDRGTKLDVAKGVLEDIYSKGEVVESFIQEPADTEWVKIPYGEFLKIPNLSYEWCTQPFITFAFYKYNEILLGHNGEGKYYLGIPDIYYPDRKDILSDPIPVERFLCRQNIEPVKGEYGYWVIPLEVEHVEK